MSPASLLSACLAFAALPLFAAGEEAAPKTVELKPIPALKRQEAEWRCGKVPPPLNGWTLQMTRGVDAGCDTSYELYAEKDGRRVFLNYCSFEFHMEGTVGDYWLVDGDSIFAIHVPKDGRKPRVVWGNRPEGCCDLEKATLQGDCRELVLEILPDGADDAEVRTVRISPDSPVELDVEHTRGMELPGMGIDHLPETRISRDGRWVSVAHGESCMSCAVDMERLRVSPVLNCVVGERHGGSDYSSIVGVAWGPDCCPAPRFLSIGDIYGSLYGYQPVSGVWSVEPVGLEESQVEVADKECYELFGEYTRPEGDTPGEILVGRLDDKSEFRFPIHDCELVRKRWAFMFEKSEYDILHPGSGWFGIGRGVFSFCGDKLLYCGKQSLITIGSQGVEDEEILISDEALAAARAKFDEEVPPIYNANFVKGGAFIAWFVAAPEGEGIAGRWRVRFYAKDGSIRREYACDVPHLPSGLNPMSNDFLTPQVVGDCAVIVTNADGKEVHYRILSPSDERDDILLRSPKQLWLIKAGHWLLGITRGENNFPYQEYIRSSRVHFIPVEI